MVKKDAQMASGAGHAGDLTPEQAIDVLKSAPDAVLVDVRTKPEWDNIGVPDLSSLNKATVFLEWLSAPAMVPNPQFVDDLKTELAARGAGPETPLLFLCRSGARSDAAAQAMTAQGYSQCHNVVGGFEGSPAMGRPGWRESGLPWDRG